MFLSERWKSGQSGDSSLGTVSVGGENTTVAAVGEQLSTTVFAPGGMYWIPRRGDSVLVIKADGTENCIAGVEMKIPEDMEPGEMRLETGNASLWLKNDGSIQLSGRVLVNGKELKQGAFEA